jgi:hypothetical protein
VKIKALLYVPFTMIVVLFIVMMLNLWIHVLKIFHEVMNLIIVIFFFQERIIIIDLVVVCLYYIKYDLFTLISIF